MITIEHRLHIDMSKVNEIDLLRYSQGKLSSEEADKVSKWLSSDPKHQQDYEAIQRIQSAATDLAGHRTFDVSTEWLNFQSKVSPGISDYDVLQLVDHTADYKTKKKISDWAAVSSDNASVIDQYESIGGALDGIRDYKRIDPSEAFEAFSKALATVPTSKSLKNTPTPASPTKVPASTPSQLSPTGQVVTMKPEREESRSVFPIWMRYAAAACAVLLVGALVWINQPKPTTATLIASTQDEFITLSDGTEVRMNKGSELTYFVDVDRVNSRDVKLSGTGSFEIAPMEEKPFTVTADNLIGITALGTGFRVEDHPDFDKVVTITEGSIRAFSVEEEDVSIVLSAVESAGFRDGGFERIIEEEEVIYDGEPHTVIDVLDHLMKASSWRVISSPYTDFDGDATVMIDLDRPYEEILTILNEKQVLSFTELNCTGCYKVTKFVGEDE
ncbi:MAG: FecR domain-containing protein [Bacteroidota bacterium]